MTDGAAKIVFNAKPKRASAPKGAAIADQPAYVPSDDLEVQFELARDAQNAPEELQKVPRQRANIPEHIASNVRGADPFGASLDWACRCYAVTCPPDYKQVFQSHIYLFNLLVALEWHPDEVYLQRLEWAFRRASDLLFDVTDGWMAFGQVVFGGPELMNCADIQIVASDRVLSRSWVGGMLPDKRYPQDEKYMPIRMGRGAWNSNRHDIIAWEEPEGYRTIVHEWGHYALKLTDEYLATRRPVFQQHARSVNLSGPASSESSPAAIVMPTAGPIRDSIMASPEGTSELVSKQWKRLSETYPRIPTRHSARSMRAGPWRLPASLPRLRLVGSLVSESVRKPIFFPIREDDDQFFALLPADIQLDHCWVYILRDGNSNHPRLFAQGTLGARSDTEPFALLGAEPNDEVVVFAERRENESIVLRATISNTGKLQNWRNVTPTTSPAISVLPQQTHRNATQAQLSVRLAGAAADRQPAHVWILPLGQAPAQRAIPINASGQSDWISKPMDVPTLDGHVLLRWGDAGEQLLISAFSQGGGPSTNNPFPENPIAAGSADGSALLFFKSETDHNGAYSHIRVVTTNAHGMSSTPPGWRERGYAYGISSNESLPLNLTPTLIMYFDPFAEQEEQLLQSGDLRICRMVNGKWTALPTYLPPGYRFVVTPLDQQNGGALTAANPTGPRLEYYKVCWVPRG